MNTLFLILSLAQADAAPRANAVQQERPERVHQRPEVAPEGHHDLARKRKRTHKRFRVRTARRNASSLFRPRRQAVPPGPGAKQTRDPYATCRADRLEDRRDQAEDKRDRAEDRRDARHQGGHQDRREDVADRREDRRDRAEDRYDSTHGCSRR